MQGWVQANITKDIVLQADFTYNLKNQNSDSAQVPYYSWNNWSPGLNSLGTYAPYTQATSYAAQSNYRDDTWTANVYATYAHTFNQAHNLKVMAGWTAEQEEYKYFYAKRTGLVDYNLPNIDLTNGTTYTTSGTNTHRATTGFFGRVNYDYNGIYLLEVNGRYDGSSRFPANDQWAFFPSASAGYRFSEEGYFKDLKQYISNGKFRASYGHIGNEAVGDNMFLSTVSQISASSVHWVNGDQKITEYGMPTLVSSSLKWERIVTTDLGLDLGFLNNSLNFGFDWFNRDTKDMLSPGQTLPAVLGASSPYQNAGALRTQGWELSLSWNHNFGDASVYASFNLSDARTKITKWANKTTLYSYLPDSSNYTEGYYYGDIWGFETDRYFTKDDFTWDASQNKYVAVAGIADQTGLETGSFTYGPGDIKYKDLNGDGKIDAGSGTVDDHGDLKVIGNAMPRYEYSFHLGAAWKGFDIDLFFQGVGKRSMWATGSTIIPMSQSNIGTFTNQLSYNLIKYVNGTNGEIDWANSSIDQDNDYPRMYSGMGTAAGKVSNIGYGQGNFYPQSKYLLNLAYLRMKNITVGYTIPQILTRKAYIQKARVYFSADNLFFLYNGAGKYQLDPETTASAGYTSLGNGSVATYGRTTPQARSVSFGLQVTF
jgi:TonB-linked SusC/RagA family outer membrane protein